MKVGQGMGLMGIMVIVLAMIVAPAANAAPPWPLQLSMDIPWPTTTADGKVVLSECTGNPNNRAYWSQTFDGSGQQVAYSI